MEILLIDQLQKQGQALSWCWLCKVGKELANHILSIVGGLDNIVCCVCLFLKEPLLGWE